MYSMECPACQNTNEYELPFVLKGDRYKDIEVECKSCGIVCLYKVVIVDRSHIQDRLSVRFVEIMDSGLDDW